MYKLVTLSLLALTTACATAGEEHNPKDIPIDTGAQPQSNVIVSAPPGTMGHGKF